MAETKPQKPHVFSSSFEREVGYSIIKINAGKLVAKGAAAEALAPWLSDAGYQDEWWSLESRDLLSRLFTIRVRGGEGLAARRVAKALAMLRTDNGWRQFEVPAHSGEGVAKLHISGDKNPRTIKLEVTGRKVRTLLANHLGNSHRVFLDRERGWLSIGWGPLLKLEVSEGRTPTLVKWNQATLNKLNLSKAELAGAIASAIEPDQEPQWCL